MRRVVLASSNQGKLKEFAEILVNVGFELHTQSEFNVADADETGLTFIENAILKARHASIATGLPALADDSGLEVDALNGAPGIYSARFAKMHDREPGDASNNALLLEQLKGVKDAQRGARFRSVLALMRHPDDPAPVVVEGIWEGRILHQPEGENGFGYDPLFYAPETQCSSALLDKAQKNQLSHRGKALKTLLARLQDTDWSLPAISDTGA